MDIFIFCSKVKNKINNKPVISLQQTPKPLHPSHTPHTDKTCEHPDCFFLRETTLETSWYKLLVITAASDPKTERERSAVYSEEG